jgi:hypothetical protein
MALCHLLTKDILPLTLPLVIGPSLQKYTPRGQEYYKNVFVTRLNLSLDAIVGSVGEAGSKEREAAWDRVRDGFKLLAGFIDSNGEEGRGLWLMGGDLPTYGDLVILAMMSAMRYGNPEGVVGRLDEFDGGRWARYWKAGEDLGLMVAGVM